MKISEIFENKTDKKVVKSPPPRNWVAKNAKTSGAGSHQPKKFNRKEKYKNSDKES